MEDLLDCTLDHYRTINSAVYVPRDIKRVLTNNKIASLLVTQVIHFAATRIFLAEIPLLLLSFMHVKYVTHIFHLTYGPTYCLRYISLTIVSSIFFTYKRVTDFLANVFLIILTLFYLNLEQR